MGKESNPAKNTQGTPLRRHLLLFLAAGVWRPETLMAVGCLLLQGSLQPACWQVTLGPLAEADPEHKKHQQFSLLSGIASGIHPLAQTIKSDAPARSPWDKDLKTSGLFGPRSQEVGEEKKAIQGAPGNGSHPCDTRGSVLLGTSRRWCREFQTYPFWEARNPEYLSCLWAHTKFMR